MRVPADEIVCKSLPEACDRTGHIFEQPRRPRIVAVDGGSAALAEQTRLGVAVGFHCTMVVKMVLREIGEHAEREVDRAGTPLHERVGGDLHHHMGAARVRHFAQQTLERQRVGRGALGRQNGVADHVLIRADQTDLCAQTALKELLEKIRCGRLAVRAGHADHCHASRRLAVPSRGELCRRLVRVGDQHTGHALGRVLGHDADRAARGGLLCVVCAVLPRAMQGEEKASLSRRAGIEGEVMYLRPRVRAEESEVIEGAQKLAELRRRVVLSPSNLALFCGF